MLPPAAFSNGAPGLLIIVVVLLSASRPPSFAIRALFVSFRIVLYWHPELVWTSFLPLAWSPKSDPIADALSPLHLVEILGWLRGFALGDVLLDSLYGVMSRPAFLEGQIRIHAGRRWSSSLSRAIAIRWSFLFVKCAYFLFLWYLGPRFRAIRNLNWTGRWHPPWFVELFPTDWSNPSSLQHPPRSLPVPGAIACLLMAVFLVCRSRGASFCNVQLNGHSLQTALNRPGIYAQSPQSADRLPQVARILSRNLSAPSFLTSNAHASHV